MSLETHLSLHAERPQMKTEEIFQNAQFLPKAHGGHKHWSSQGHVHCGPRAPKAGRKHVARPSVALQHSHCLYPAEVEGLSPTRLAAHCRTTSKLSSPATAQPLTACQTGRPVTRLRRHCPNPLWGLFYSRLSDWHCGGASF